MALRKHRELGQFLAKAFVRDIDGMLDLHQRSGNPSVTKAVLSDVSGSAGGYLIPQQLIDDLMDDLGEEAIFRRGCDVVAMASDTLQLPYPDLSTAQAAGTAPFFGGIKLSFAGPVNTPTESEPQFRMLELRPYLLSAYSVLGNNLLNDVDYLADFLVRLFLRAILWYEDYYFFRGTGTGQPTGILTANATISVTRTTANQFTQQDAAAMTAKLIPFSAGRAVFALSPTVAASLTTATYNWGTWVKEPIRDDGSHLTIMGKSAYVTEKLPALGTKGDVMLFDPRAYVIGEREETRIEFSQEVQTQFNQNQSVMRVIRRVDGQPWLASSVTLADGSSTASCYVALQ